MGLNLFYWLYSFFGVNILQYISVRAGIAFVISFLIAVVAMPKFIAWARLKAKHQPIYEHAPQTHQVKVGTPTMGGVVFVGSAIFATFLTAKLTNFYVIGGLVVLALFCLIGMKDDYAKINKQSNQAGLKPREKLYYQLGVSFFVSSILIAYGHTTTLYVPFYKYPILDIGLFMLFFWMLIMIAASNAVNLTDGLDGLAVVPSIVAFISLSALVYVSGNAILSGYLLIEKIELAGELTVLGASLIGSMIAFLWYNAHPAEVFMGDSGSLAIGGLMGYMAIIAKSEFLLILIGFIFVVETVSVILQVGSFKLRQKRVFLMAPIHHHYEKKGWKENKIIVRFWIIAFMANLAALLTLKLR